MSRRGMLKELLGARDRQLSADNSQAETEAYGAGKGDGPQPAAAIPVRSESPVRTGAVGAMGKALGKLAGAAEEARALIAAGDAVVSLETAIVEASFISDRVASTAEDDNDLVASIRDHGQQVPILVRPHPTKAGHYQAAYGHRRLRAAAELGRTVRAVVKPLTDTELVIAQGQENSARLDLSFIERALFARSMEKRGIDRAAIMAALRVEKTLLSRLIAIARDVPDDVIQLIGPAPKTGRPRWDALLERLKSKGYDTVLRKLASDPKFTALDSDSRFARFFSALAQGNDQPAFQAWQNSHGREIARIKTGDGKVTLVLDEKSAPDFGAFVISQLEELYERYRAKSSDRS